MSGHICRRGHGCIEVSDLEERAMEMAIEKERTDEPYGLIADLNYDSPFWKRVFSSYDRILARLETEAADDRRFAAQLAEAEAAGLLYHFPRGRGFAE